VLELNEIMLALYSGSIVLNLSQHINDTVNEAEYQYFFDRQKIV
jgi:hypothetical protein